MAMQYILVAAVIAGMECRLGAKLERATLKASSELYRWTVSSGLISAHIDRFKSLLSIAS